MKNKLYGIIAGLIVMLSTITVYLLVTKSIYKLPMCWICLTALLLSEAATICAFLFSGGNLKRVGITVTLTIQLLSTFVLSIVFINLLVFAYLQFIVYYFVSVVIATLICIAFLAFESNSERKNEAFKDAKISMLSIRSVVNSMLNSENGKQYSELLRQLDENLRFSDDSSVHEMDETIYRRVCELSANIGSTEYDVEGAVRSVNDLIRQRNFMVKNQKAFR